MALGSEESGEPGKEYNALKSPNNDGVVEHTQQDWSKSSGIARLPRVPRKPLGVRARKLQKAQLVLKCYQRANENVNVCREDAGGIGCSGFASFESGSASDLLYFPFSMGEDLPLFLRLDREEPEKAYSPSPARPMERLGTTG